MSGGYVPYRLRQNKAVDRFAFIELLKMLNRYKECHIKDYMYVGFGGPSLEDFKLLHTYFGNRRMVSLEGNDKVFKRQIYNKPLTAVTCMNTRSRDFLSGFVRQQATCVWFDFTEARSLRAQVEEFQHLLILLEAFDIVRLTLNANPSNWVASTSELKGSDLFDARYAELQRSLGELLPSNVSSDEMSTAHFPHAITQVVKHAAIGALRGRRDLVFQPLTIFAYADGQQMVTVTGILLPRDKVKALYKYSSIDKWQLANLNWEMPKRINVPDFSVREKLYVDSRLPKYKAETIHKWLGLQFASKESESIEMLKIYAEFYRHYPYFSEIVF